jgi:chromosome segregation ATPase
MSRITKEEVHATADTLNKKGTKPTVIRIREMLGKGSYSTIGRHLDEWSAPEEDAKAEAPDVPEAVTALLPEIWATCYAEAEALQKAAADEIRAEIDEYRNSLKSAQAAADEGEEEIERLQKSLSETIGKLKITEEELLRVKRQTEIAEAKTQELRQRAEIAEKLLESAINADPPKKAKNKNAEPGEPQAEPKDNKTARIGTRGGRKGIAEPTAAAELEKLGQQRIDE